MIDLILNLETRPVQVDLNSAFVAECCDTEQLHEWFDLLTLEKVEVVAFVEAAKLTGHQEKTWFDRIGRKAAYLSIALKWLESRLLELGETPNYLRSDPRGKQLSLLERKLKDLQRRESVSG